MPSPAACLQDLASWQEKRAIIMIITMERRLIVTYPV